jgi:hypothetical protein
LAAQPIDFGELRFANPPYDLLRFRNDRKLKAMRRYDTGKTAPLSALSASFRWDCR